jgi:hypothetical protein
MPANYSLKPTYMPIFSFLSITYWRVAAIYWLGLLVATAHLAAQSSAPNHANIVHCATDMVVSQALNNPQTAQKYAQSNAFVQQYIEKQAAQNAQKGGSEILTIPVVVHIVWSSANAMSNISDEQVLSQITALNEIYRRQNENAANTRPEFLPVAADCQIEFCLAQRDPNGNPSTGITRTETDSLNFTTDAFKYSSTGGTDAWDTQQYLNIWVVNRLYSGMVLGYAYLPGTAPTPEVDGVAIVFYTFGTVGILDEPYVLGATTAHEVGHYLGLHHTWAQGNNAPDPDCIEFCILDDDVADTPNSCHANFGCIGYINSCGAGTPDDLPDMTENYMDYANDACQNAFTLGQKARMRAILSFGGYRYNLPNDPLLCTPIQQGNDDVRLLDIISPTGPNNCTQVTPTISVQNYGTTVLYTFNISYTLDGVAHSYDWVGELAPFASTNINLLPINTASNTVVHQLEVLLSLPNGNPDFDMADNATEQSFATIAVGTALPIMQGFETALPATYSISNPDASIGFAITDQAHHSTTGTQSFYMANFGYNAPLTTDALHLPKADLLNAPNPVLEFYVAYALQDAQNPSQTDTLHIALSDNCGQSYEVVRSVWGDSLVTAPATALPFVPNDTQWRRIVVPLHDYIATRTLQARISQVRGAGNNLYIDNLGIYAEPQPLIVVIDTTNNDTTTIDTSVNIIRPNLSKGLRISPNPTQNQSMLYYQSLYEEAITLTWFDRTGKQVGQQNEMAHIGTNQYTLSANLLSKGVYIVELRSPHQREWAKWVVW